MNIRTFLKGALFFSLLAPAQITAQTSDRRDGMRFVPNVPEQVFNLTQYADPLGLDITTTPNPSACRHYQGMALPQKSFCRGPARFDGFAAGCEARLCLAAM